MTASQRLKMLQSFTNPRHGPLPLWWLESMVAALPQLVAVVEALEKIRGVEPLTPQARNMAELAHYALVPLERELL